MSANPEDTPRADADRRSGHQWTTEQIAFYRQAIAELLPLVIQAGLSPAQAEDIVQMIVLKFLEQPLPFNPESTPAQGRAWLITVAHHEVANVFRERGRHSTQSLETLAAEPRDRREEESARWAKTAQQCERVHRWMEEQKVVDALNYRLLYGREVDGCAIATLAAQEGLTKNEVRCRIYRMRSRLRAWLATHADDADDES